MSRRTRQLSVVIVGVVLVGFGGRVAAAPAPAPVAQGCAGNLLVNPDFEGPSRKTESEGTSLSSAVGNGWSPWFVRGDATFNREPEFKVEQVRIGGDPARVRSGVNSMKWFTSWGTHTAGIYQRVAVAPGTPLVFTIHAMAYTGEDDGWDDATHTFLSDPVHPGNYRLSVGIDPTGAAPSIGSPPPDSVIWSPAVLQYDVWVPLTVAAVARAGAVTVYAKGQPEWSVKHNDSWWEDACLRVGRGPAGSAPAPADGAAPADAAAAGAGAAEAPGAEAAATGGGAAASGSTERPAGARRSPAVPWPVAIPAMQGMPRDRACRYGGAG